MATSDRKHTILGETEQPSRTALNAGIESVNDFIQVANTTARAALAAAVGATPTRPLLVYRTDAAPGYKLELTEDGTTWWAVPATPGAMGKMWRTSGNQALTTSLAKVGMDASRVSGGVVFDNANDELVLPLDGFYEVIQHGYISGGAHPYSGYFAVQRERAATSSITWGSPGYQKTDIQDRTVGGTAVYPLKAGDQLSLLVISTVATGAAYGADEHASCSLTVTYRGPLNGAAPI